MKARIGVDAELGQAHASVGKAEHLGSSRPIKWLVQVFGEYEAMRSDPQLPG